LALAQQDLGRFDESIETYRALVKQYPDDFLAQTNLGQLLSQQWKMDEAEAALRQALRAQPDFPQAWNNLATVLKEMGRLEEALDCYRKAIAIAPDFLIAQNNYLLMIHYSQNFDGPQIVAEMKKWNDRFAQSTPKLVDPKNVDRTAKRKLRIGYVSPDFGDHVVGKNMLPLFREHNREAFEIYSYSNLPRGDAITDEFRRLSHKWREVSNLSDAAVAEMILNDRIDILVDLAGHTHRNRLLTFARKPAPVQVTFGGYPGGTGLTAMDFHLTDQYLDPPGMTENHYTEKLIRMPDSFWCYDPIAMGVTDGPPINELPALSNGYVTFGCLNNLGKISERSLNLWNSILADVPNSKILLLAPEGSCRTRIIEKLGVDSSRVQFVGRMSRQDYLLTHHRIDLALDSLPYGCHTTGLDCLWMSVPIVTRVGETAAGRAVFSHLSNLGLTDLSADTDEKFVQLATSLARDLPRLANLRATIRQKMLASPLTDAKRFARNVENAFQEMWRQ
jgi:predicted O-linked N-acetylglucosamine transferase (SPINDLY family)